MASDSNWVIVPKESWRDEIKLYLPRLEAAAKLDPRVEAALRAHWPGAFWAQVPVPRGVSIAARLGIFSANVFSIARHLCLIVYDQWRSGLFTIVPLNTRFIFESWGAIHFARITLARLIREEDLDREEQRTNRLTFGARSEVLLPWGGVSEVRSFNVMDFVQSLSDVCAEAEDIYNFLSEASHPNLIQNSYFQMAGPPISNWDNPAFKEHGHTLLTKAAEALEVTSKGMDEDIVAIIDEGTRYILGAIEKNNNGA